MKGIVKQFLVLVTGCRKTSIAVSISLLYCPSFRLPIEVAHMAILEKTIGYPLL